MNNTQAVIRINLTTKELEIKGSEEFLRTFDRRHLAELMEVITKMGVGFSTNTTVSQINSAPQPAFEHFTEHEAKDEVDNEYLRRFMDGYNNSFEKKHHGNDAENHTINSTIENSKERESPKNLNLYASLPKSISASNKALVVAYELQTTNVESCFSKQDLFMALRKYQPKKPISDNFLSFYLNNGFITYLNDETYRLTDMGLAHLKSVIEINS